MIRNLIGSIFTFSSGYFFGKNYSTEIDAIFTGIRYSNEVPMSWTTEGIKIFGKTIIKYTENNPPK